MRRHSFLIRIAQQGFQDIRIDGDPVWFNFEALDQVLQRGGDACSIRGSDIGLQIADSLSCVSIVASLNILPELVDQRLGQRIIASLVELVYRVNSLGGVRARRVLTWRRICGNQCDDSRVRIIGGCDCRGQGAE